MNIRKFLLISSLILIPSILQASFISFSQTKSTVNENASSIRIAVNRSNGKEAASVNYTTSDGSAKAGNDYTKKSGTLKWKDGESGNKFISIPILNDNELEAKEDFTINLSKISGDASFGILTSMTIIVNDDDDPCEKKYLNNIIRSQNSGLWNQAKTWNQARIPRAGDIVIIEHNVIAPAEPIKLDKGEFCIQKQGQLISQASLEIHAAVIHNYGTIRGADGKNGFAKPIEKCNFFQHATAGSRIEIRTDKLINKDTGKIIAGKGGDDLTYQYLSNSIGKCQGTPTQGGLGGSVEIYSTNMENRGVIKAGDGGKAEGEGTRNDDKTYVVDGPTNGGNGGFIHIWTNLKQQAISANYGTIESGIGGDALISKEFLSGNIAGQVNNDFSKSGKGGNIKLFLDLQDGIVKAHQGSLIYWGNHPNKLIAGKNASFSAEKIIFAGDSSEFDLSQLQKNSVVADEMTIAVWKTGIVNFIINKLTKDNHCQHTINDAFNITRKFEIFADQINKCKGNTVADIDESQTVNLAQLSVTNTRSFPLTEVAGTKVPIELRLFNNGTNTDNYILTTTSEADDWQFSALTTPIEIEAKEPKNFTLNVTLANTQGVENTITVKATSKTDPNAVAKIKIKMKVAPANTEQPIAKFHFSAKTFDAPTSIKLDATASSDSDGEIVDYKWFSSNGLEASGKIANMQFNHPGIYKITLKVRDNDGAIANFWQQITAQPYDPEPAAPKPASSCQLFYVKQNTQQQSQFFTISVPEFKLTKLSKLNKDFDIQDIAIDPKTHFIYASSGKKGNLYKADSLTGKLFLVGDIGFKQVDSLAFHANGTLYGWAQGHGMITIDLKKGNGTVVIPTPLFVETLTLTDKSIFYGSIENDLWKYDQ
ncbi:Calx-beta domain-containing protein, partial [Candidatus Marithrix sp. Canyon 246]